MVNRSECYSDGVSRSSVDGDFEAIELCDCCRQSLRTAGSFFVRGGVVLCSGCDAKEDAEIAKLNSDYRRLRRNVIREAVVLALVLVAWLIWNSVK